MSVLPMQRHGGCALLAFAAALLAGCVTGTTPDCTDASVCSVVFDAGASSDARDAPEADASDTGTADTGSDTASPDAGDASDAPAE